MKTHRYCTNLDIDAAAPCFRQMTLKTAEIDSGWVGTIGARGFLAGFAKDSVVTTTSIDEAIIFQRSSDCSRAIRGFGCYNGTYNLSNGLKIVQGWVDQNA